MVLRICLLFAFVSFSVGEEELILRCLPNDADCVRRQPLHFLSKIYAGYPNLGIEPIDPLIVTSTDVNLDNDAGVVLHFKNINITGFKNSKLEYSYDPATKLGIQIMKAEITIFSDVEIVLSNSKKTFIGTYYAKSTVRGKSDYTTGTKDIDGKLHFAMGPETTSCEVLGEPTATLGSELQRALDQDEDAVKLKPNWEANATTLRKKILCGLADNGFSAFLKSSRALAKAYDVHQFFIETPNAPICYPPYPKMMF